MKTTILEQGICRWLYRDYLGYIGVILGFCYTGIMGLGLRVTGFGLEVSDLGRRVSHQHCRL